MSLLAILLAMFLAMVKTSPIPSGGGLDATVVLTPLNSLPDTSKNLIESVAKAKTITNGFPDSGRQTAVKEQKYLESLPIKLDDKYGQLQQFVANIVNPKPIVDTIYEDEKYGNDAAKGRAVSTAIIGGFEAFSNVLNTIIDFPFVTAKALGRSLTSSLNVVGGKLVGLA